MIFCRPKDKEILNDRDGDGNGDKNSGDVVGMGTHSVGTGRGWGHSRWGRGGDGG